jgi:hypothetical protein
MTRLILIPLALAACACQMDRLACDPVTQLCVCERPTATLALSPRGEGTAHRDAPAVDRPEPPRDHVTEQRDDTEPDRQTDPDGWAGWKDTHPTGWRGR